MKRFTPILAWIDGQRGVMCERVTRWANVNSGTYNVAGLKRMTAMLLADFAVLGGVIEELPVEPALSIDSNGQKACVSLGNAIRIVNRPEAPLQVLLVIHMDTVYPPEHPFQQTTVLDDNTLRGPGAVDAKGGLAVMLTALQALEQSPDAANIGWEVLINPDEEIGSLGSAGVLAHSALGKHLALLFEPAMPGGALVERRRGAGNFDIVIRGRSAHAGRDFDKGRNAVVAAADLAIKLHAWNEKFPGVNVNVGRIDGGGPVNLVPDLAICRINVRTTVLEDESVIRREFEKLIAEANTRDGLTAELHGTFTSPPKIPDDATRVLMSHITTCGADLGIPIEWKPSGGTCDGNRLAAAGIPTVDSLGPRGGDLHSPTEFVLLDSLTECAKLTALLLLKLASGEIPWPPR